MIRELPIDLQSLVCNFAYNANLGETKEANQIYCTMVVNAWVFDYSNESEYVYNRHTKRSAYFGRPYCRATKQIRDSPFVEFFVWFCQADLWNELQMGHIV